MKKGMMTQLSNYTPPPQSPVTASGKHSKTGLIITVIGTVIIFLAAVVYIAIGQAVVGIVGIFFVIVIAFFCAGDKIQQT